MKKRIYTLIVSLTALLSSTSSFSQELPFQDGESLNFVITYQCGFSADMVSLNLDLKGIVDPTYGPAFHAVTNIKTFKFWDSFYKMRDIYETKFVADRSVRPFWFHRDANEGKSYQSEAWLEWNRAGDEVKVKITKKDKPAIDTLYKEPSVLRDIINAIYFARCMDFKKLEAGESETVQMTPYRDILELRVRVVGKEQKKVGKLGTFNTVKLGLVIIPKDVDKAGSSGFKVGASEGGDYLGDEKIFLWLSDDENHAPLFFQAPASIGSIKGKLNACSGLKYPLNKVE